MEQQMGQIWHPGKSLQHRQLRPGLGHATGLCGHDDLEEPEMTQGRLTRRLKPLEPPGPWDYY